MDKICKFEAVMDHVYGKYSSSSWRPKAFKKSHPRYLWTDAFGVCNYLTLFQKTKNENFLKQAEILINEVHNILGKTRDGSKRLNNISTEDHPLNGGLRIGKPDSEGAGMSSDGQYFHYLTKWMFALNRMALISKNEKYNKWGIELVQAIHWKFCSKDKQRMFWKMSIDLSKALVNSEGGLDTFDGLTMYLILQNTQKNFDKFENMNQEQKSDWEEKNLKPEIEHMKLLVAVRYKGYSTNDSLDGGEALWLSHFFPEFDYAKQLKISSSFSFRIFV
uniref:Alpha-1,2-Mannosidase n=1 Tax=Panagrolaimus superbus TaxID=310955 RepID=A0A914YXZ2_9BILA